MNDAPDPRAKRIYDAWLIRQTQFPSVSKGKLADLAKLVAQRDASGSLKTDPSSLAQIRKLGNRITKYFTHGLGKNTALPGLLEEVLEIPANFLEIHSQTSLPEWSLSQNPGNVTGTLAVKPVYVMTSTAFRGGASVFTVDPSKIDDQLASGDGRVHIEVSDTSLLPGVKPGQTVVFKPTDYPRLDMSLLIRSKAEPELFAIRVYSPDTGESGEYIDCKHGNRNAALPGEEWATVGYAIGVLSEEGIMLNG